MEKQTKSPVDWVKAKEVLRSAGYRSWSQVAAKMGIQRQSLYSIRTNRIRDPKLSTVLNLCTVLGCCLNDILREPLSPAAPPDDDRTHVDLARKFSGI